MRHLQEKFGNTSHFIDFTMFRCGLHLKIRSFKSSKARKSTCFDVIIKGNHTFKKNGVIVTPGMPTIISQAGTIETHTRFS